MNRFKKKLLCFLLVTALCVVLMGFSLIGSPAGEGEPPAPPLMRMNEGLWKEFRELYDNAPRAYIDPNIASAPSFGSPGSFSLLPHLDYVTVDRDQGTCGNCWTWAGQGVVGIALDVQEGIFDRLSVQRMASCWPGNPDSAWVCCGGFLDWYADWYSTQGFIIPWSNTNADWDDGGRACADLGSGVACGTISTSPSYTITKCVAETIPTHGVGQATAITNIKNILLQNRAVYLGFYLGTDADWNNFLTFWWNQGETAIWNPDYSCGSPCWVNQCAGHAVLVVGWNDDDADPANHYWIVLNSWGDAAWPGTPTRTNGLFRLAMDMNYDCSIQTASDPTYPSFWFETLDVAFDITPGPTVPESTIPTSILTSLGTIVLLIVSALALASKKSKIGLRK